MIFNYCEGLESLTQTHAVGDDAAVEFLQLVDRTKDAVSLKLVKLVPDDSLFDACLGFDDLVFRDFFQRVMEDAEQRFVVNELR